MSWDPADFCTRHGLDESVVDELREADSGICADPPDYEEPDPVDPAEFDADRWADEIEELFDPQEPTDFDPPEGVQFP